MKAFIDLTFTYWMSHKPRASMFSKKAVVISTAAGAGAGSAIKDITNTLLYWGVPYVKSYGKAIQATDWEHIKPELKEKINKDMVRLQPVTEKYDVAELQSLIEDHVRETNSERGKEVLMHFRDYLPHFKKIVPHDYQRILSAISKYEEQGISRENAEFEAFNEITNATEG